MRTLQENGARLMLYEGLQMVGSQLLRNFCTAKGRPSPRATKSQLENCEQPEQGDFAPQS